MLSGTEVTPIPSQMTNLATRTHEGITVLAGFMQLLTGKACSEAVYGTKYNRY